MSTDVLRVRRRTLLPAAATALVALGLPLAPAADAARAGLDRRSFERLVGRRIRVAVGGRTHRVRVEAVRDLPHAPAGSRQRYAVELSSPEPLPDGMAVLRHARLGRPRVYLGGIYAEADRRYEIVVNQWDGS